MKLYITNPSTTLLSLKVTATDQDGPINNLLRYSIVSGDPQQQFSIHPRSGEITVRTALDREEVGVCVCVCVTVIITFRLLTSLLVSSPDSSLLSDGAGS